MEKIPDIFNKIVAGIKDQILLFSLAIILLLVAAPSEFRYIIFAIYIVGVSGFIIYARVVNRRPSGDALVAVHADLSKTRDYTLVEILNTGTEDVINLRVTISWLQKEGEQTRSILRFFREGENPITTSATEVRSLRAKERVYADSIPRYSIDGKIHVHIVGEGAVSHKLLDYSTTVPNEPKTD